jgi:hypothetical protein
MKRIENKMTRKDYIVIAEVLRKFSTSLEITEFEDLVSEFSEVMKKDNDRFDTERFSRACWGRK